jgi:dGTPase
MTSFRHEPSSDLHNLKDSLDLRESQLLSPLAARSTEAVRRRPDPRIAKGHRQDYAVDSDRILHSLAYTRYIDKTQVFYLIDNDHITHRVLHVQLVSKISRTVGRYLALNEDLIEAIALGHDIGHCPFGHDGEKCLSALCQAAGIGPFLHNLQSVRFLDVIERKGRGCNLTLQVLDGILSHDGEIHDQALTPHRNKSFELLDQEMEKKAADPDFALRPMTLEACVVRMADTVAYIGRDIEDAIRLGLIQRKDLPPEATRVLGDTNGTIVYRLVTDIIKSSLGKPAVAFSAETSEALQILKDFNLERIYLNPKMKPKNGDIECLFQVLFDRYLRDLEEGNQDSIIFTEYLRGMSAAYRDHSSSPEMVRDFIAGMTDEYFLRQCPPELRPKRIALGD